MKAARGSCRKVLRSHRERCSGFGRWTCNVIGSNPNPGTLAPVSEVELECGSQLIRLLPNRVTNGG